MTPSRRLPRPRSSERGTVIIVAMVLAAAIGVSLVSYLKLANNSLKQSQRTFLAETSGHLIEAGLEEAIYCFNQMGNGVALDTAWPSSDWAKTGSTAKRTLSFTLGQNARAAIKVYVDGYNGSNTAPVIVARAIITPHEGPTIEKYIKVTLQKNLGRFARGVVSRGEVDWNGHPLTDSWQSNPSNSPTGPWAGYPGTGARSNSGVASVTGPVSLGSGGMVKGSFARGSSASYDGTGTVTGAVSTNFSYDFAMPTFPTAGNLTFSYNLGASVPATLPRTLDQRAADNRYYYFTTAAAISGVTIDANSDVTIVGSSNTRITGNVTIPSTGSFIAYMDGALTGRINNSSWSGACQIYTSTTTEIVLNGNENIRAVIFAPNAPIRGNGGGSSGAFYGAFVGASVRSNGHMDFHYDESLGAIGTSGKAWSLSEWRELRSPSEKSAFSAHTSF